MYLGSGCLALLKIRHCRFTIVRHGNVCHFPEGTTPSQTTFLCATAICRGVSRQSKMVFRAAEFHVAASWALLLFLAAATQQVDAISSTVDATTSSTDTCSDACFQDTVCYECAFETDDEAFQECLEIFEYDVTSDVCSWIYVGRACCEDYASPNDCLGNSAFVEYNLCIINNYTFLEEGEECTALTCSFGSAGETITDDLADDDTDTGIVDNDAEGTDDATGIVDDATSAVDDDVEGTDGATGEIVGNDTDGADGIAYSGSSTMLTLVLGLAILTAAPLLTVSL